MCMKLPKPLNPEAEEWRPTLPAPPPLHPLPPPLPCIISYPHTQYEHPAAMPPICGESSGQQRPKNGKKFLPPRLRRASKLHSEPPKLEWRPKVAPGTAAAASSKTTLMIRNIPNQLRRDFMLKFLDGYCKTYSVAYDFFYLPFDFRRLGNLGYAFVNFTRAAAAQKMKNILCNYEWRNTYTDTGELISSNKVCEINWAKIQGKEALIKRVEKIRFMCDDEEFLAVVLDPPRDGSDPNPPAPVNVGRICRCR
ncbi:protein MEI2-like 7 [Salvia miltiorrhiza]|uniref:protein MEI2-like 7 n=1 Tax=Salvia miltiorrhiza TaxID=226208 RepID=UPI0025ACFD76|nr:protein MEI2-like 7 [Salvia miltiorrhiza]